MSTEEKEKYDEAIRLIIGLFRSERHMVRVRQDRRYYREQNLPNLWILLGNLSITQNDLDQLQVIHVTGTKGKGSTCTFIESILRRHGYKTLFYSSPHVREVRERIRLSGLPLSYEKFTNYFWEVYNKLKHHKNEDNTFLHFYNFMTCLCVYVAVKEKELGNVEAVVIEGMLGGEFDYTNIFEDKAVCCMTSIALDHTNIIGPTVEDIAWYKSGIFRKNVPVISAVQPDSAMEMMRKRAAEKETSVTITPSLDKFGEDIELGVDGDVQKINAPIALLAVRAWIKKNNLTSNGASTINVEEQCISPITKLERKGLKYSEAFGKDLVVKFEGLTFYLDGAHTLESMQNCIKWFEKKRMQEANGKSNIKRLLIFTIPHERIPGRLLTPLRGYPFDIVLFPAHLTAETETSLDHYTDGFSNEERIGLATETKDTWDQLNNDVIKNGNQTTIFCRSLIECVQRLSKIRLDDKQAAGSSFFQVLVTGSIGMIGKFLRILDTAPENPEYMLHPICHLNGTEKNSS